MRYILLPLILISMLTTTKTEATQYDYVKQDIDVTNPELKCLALNVYFESRGESSLGQKAVAWVTINRVNDPEYPDTICDVVHDHYQFSWVLDKNSNIPTEKNAWNQSLYIAWYVLNNKHVLKDPTDGAVMFHTLNSKPSWRKAYIPTAKIDAHIFYKKGNI